MIALYVLGAILLLLLTGVMLAPLLEDAEPAVELDRLPPEERREAALEALGELEFELETGKLDEEEYRQLRTHFGRAVLEAEEALAGSSEGTPVVCSSCGGEIRPGARFCPGCGEPRPGVDGEAPPSGGGEQGPGGAGRADAPGGA